MKTANIEEEGSTDSGRRLNDGSDSSTSNLEVKAINIEVLLLGVEKSRREECRKAFRLMIVSEDEPLMALNWINAEGFLRAAVAYGGIPFVPHTVDGLKDYIMKLGRAVDSAPPMYRFAFPCTLAQTIQTSTNFANMCFDPWFRAVAASDPTCVPIASFSVLTSHSNVDRIFLSPPDMAAAALWD
jgi:hypothetical protein